MIIKYLIKATNKIGVSVMKCWNSLKLRTYGSSVEVKGKATIIGKFYLRLKEPCKLVIGDNFYMTSGFCYNPLSRNLRAAFCLEKGAVLKIGDNVGIGGSSIRVHQSVTIGNNVKIGGDSLIMDSDGHSLDAEIRRTEKDVEAKHNAPIVIEDDVLIGTRCVILKGVTIGRNSVIGAGSIVTKDIPANCIAGGNPCKVIKRLTPPHAPSSISHNSHL